MPPMDVLRSIRCSWVEPSFVPVCCALALTGQGKRARRSEEGEEEGAGPKSSASAEGGSPSSSSPPSNKSKPDGEDKVTRPVRVSVSQPNKSRVGYPEER